MPRQFRARHDSVPNLREYIGERVRRMRYQDRIRVIVRRDVLQGVKVLRHQHELHHVLRRRTLHGLGEVLNRVLEA